MATEEREHEPALAAAIADLRETLDALAGAGGGDPLDIIGGAVDLRERTEALLAVSVAHARSTGVTWQAIGDLLGTSRQAAFQRFGQPIDPRTGDPMTTAILPDAARRGTEVFELVANRRWADLRAQFDVRMRLFLSVKKLGDAWAQSAATVGAFERQGEPFARAMDRITVVDVPLHFEAGDLVGRVSFRADGRIAGLFVLTPSAAAGS